MIFKLLRLRKQAKTVHGAIENPGAAAKEFTGGAVLGVVLPFMILVSVVFGIVLVILGVLGFMLSIKALIVIFWILLGIFVIMQIVFWLVRRALRSMTGAMMGMVQRAYAAASPTIMLKSKKHLLGFILFAVAILMIALVLFIIGPNCLVALIGEQWIFPLVFVFSVFGGVSTLSSGTFYVTVGALAAAGVNPWLMAVVAGFGLTIGDFVFFTFGNVGRETFLDSAHPIMRKIHDWMLSRPRWMIPLIAFVWAGFTPLPGDILMLTLAIGRYPFRKILPWIIAGNIAFMVIVGWSGVALG